MRAPQSVRYGIADLATFALWVTVLLATMPMSARAHDLEVTGVVRILLTEYGGGNYQLAVLDIQAPPLYDLSTVIPSRCELPAEPSASLRFQCPTPLNYSDSLVFPWQLSGLVMLVHWQDGSKASAYFRGTGSTIEVPLSGLNAAAGSRLDLASRYLVLGTEHILGGIDHLLFVLGLLLLLQGPWTLVQTVTAFTLAHSLTLAMAALGLVPVAAAPVEAVIALSIVLLAREVIMSERGHRHLVHRYPWVVAFVFGLFHGFGFAGALGELGLHQNDIPFALLFFNLGVEAGQLAFILLILVLHFLIRRWQLPWHSNGARLVTGYGLGAVAMFWFLQRLPDVIPIGA